MGTSRVETDIGEGFLKALGNKEGPHALASELVGTSLAEWLGLRTLDYALVHIDPDDDIPLGTDRKAAPGPAFITRAEDTGVVWGGGDEPLRRLTNPNMISELVVLDTWVQNCDRHSPDGTRVNRDNVFFVQYPESPKRPTLVAMDHTHAFTCGAELTRRLSAIETVQNRSVFGNFPEFAEFLNRGAVRECAHRLEAFDAGTAREFLGMVPGEWEVGNPVRNSWFELLLRRAEFVSQNIERFLWPQMGIEEGVR